MTFAASRALPTVSDSGSRYKVVFVKPNAKPIFLQT
jgi:hypothetical protein